MTCIHCPDQLLTLIVDRSATPPRDVILPPAAGTSWARVWIVTLGASSYGFRSPCVLIAVQARNQVGRDTLAVESVRNLVCSARVIMIAGCC